MSAARIQSLLGLDEPVRELVARALAAGWIRQRPPENLTLAGLPRKRDWWPGHPVRTPEERRATRLAAAARYNRLRREQYARQGLNARGQPYVRPPPKNMNRIKLKRNPVDIPATRAAAEALVRQLTTNLLAQQAAKTEMDQRITAIKKEYEATISKLEAAIQPMMEALHAWADAHPEEFGGKKSLDMLHAVVGWRTNPPSIKPLRGFTWQAVLDRIKELGRWEFIRTREDVNREALLAARESENLKAFYCQVCQEEEFFCDPKTTPVETRQSVEA